MYMFMYVINTLIQFDCLFVLSEFKHILVTTGKNIFWLSDSELISLNDSCTISFEDYPKEEGIAMATGLMIQDRVVVCGGATYDNYTNECYNIYNGETVFKNFSSMQAVRAGASSLNIQGKMWITGGYFENNGCTNSTEFIDLNSDNSFPPALNIDLPKPTYNHVILNLNDTTSLLIGGANVSNPAFPLQETHYFNHLKYTWTDGPNLLYGRYMHTAGVIKDMGNHKEHIAVVGGRVAPLLFPTQTVEMLLYGQNTWTLGMFVYYLQFGGKKD